MFPVKDFPGPIYLFLRFLTYKESLLKISEEQFHFLGPLSLTAKLLKISKEMFNFLSPSLPKVSS